MEQLVSFLHGASRVLWGPWTLALILGTGLLFSIRLKWKHLISGRQIIANTFGAIGKKNRAKGEISSFAALASSLAACLGVGTIVGVATAIATGGPGAIFWMWVAGLLSMATKFAELTMGVHFRTKNAKGEWVGGPMYYMKHGLGKPGRVLAIIFSVAVPITAIGIGNMVQANAVAGAMETTFSVPRLATGIGLVVVVAAVTLGGIKKLSKFAERFVPVAAFVVFGISIVGVVLNFTAVPAALATIVQGAFTFQAGLGGFAGAGIMMAMRMGIARGLFSNEGGLGSAPIVNATAQVDHPVKQGFWGTVLVFVDTHVLCTLVALVVLTSGAWTQLNAYGEALTGAPLILEAYNSILPFGIGGAAVTIAILFFGGTTMMGWGFYGEKGLEYLFGTKSNVPYRIFWLIPLVFGALGSITMVWAFSDVFNSLMLIPNLIALVSLSGLVAKLTKDYFDSKPYVSYYDEQQQLLETEMQAANAMDDDRVQALAGIPVTEAHDHNEPMLVG